MGVGPPLLKKGRVKYVKVHFDTKSKEFDLNTREDMLHQMMMKVEGSIGRIITSLYGVKKYLILKVVGYSYG